MKKVLSVILAVIMFALTFSFSADAAAKKALPLSAGIEALRSKFDFAVAGEEEGYAIDYCYYSPVGKSDNTKYPVVIFLHGIGHGAYPGSQIESVMAYWASAELQSRWTDTGGAYIVLPRCPEDSFEYWNSSLVNPLRKMIDDFIRENKANVDTSRIFIGGSSAGGEMTWNMITTYPEYFAGAYPMSATGIMSSADVKAAKNVAIWVFASKLDPIVNYPTVTLPLWDKICKYNANPKNCRLSSFGMVCNPDGKVAGENHRLFQTITYDFFTIDNKPYPNVETEDGNGNTVNFKFPNGMISWMRSIHSDFTGKRTSEGEKTNIFEYFLIFFRNFFMKIGNIIQKMLGFV